jgi:hypothetical protein
MDEICKTYENNLFRIHLIKHSTFQPQAKINAVSLDLTKAHSE